MKVYVVWYTRLGKMDFIEGIYSTIDKAEEVRAQLREDYLTAWVTEHEVQ